MTSLISFNNILLNVDVKKKEMIWLMLLIIKSFVLSFLYYY